MPTRVDVSPPGLIAPHGGTLIDQVLTGDSRLDALDRAQRRVRLALDMYHWMDVELICTGAYSPLRGFMDADDCRAVLQDLHLPGGYAWTLPITLPVPETFRRRIHAGDEVVLVGPTGTGRALLQVEAIFRRDLPAVARSMYGTDDPAHPGVARLLTEPPTCMAGPVVLLVPEPAPFPDLALSPAACRQRFSELGWSTVVGFQTRNPIHRAHEYIQKAALETVDGILIHPLVGPTKADDVPSDVRVESYRVLLDRYFPPDRALLAAFPAAMRYAGPREAVFHALVRKNFGCSHFIVGRDHAGCGSWYGPLDAQAIFREFAPDALGVVPLCFDHTFYCRRCGGMASTKTCPHGGDDRLTLSGTRVRALLAAGQLPPPEITRPEVAAVLAGRSVAGVAEG